MPALDFVLQQHQRQLHADIGRADTGTDLDQCRLIEFENHEQIEQRKQKTCHRRNHAKKQVGHIGRLTAIPRLDELEPRLFLTDPFGQVEAVDNGLDVLLGRLPKLGFLAFLRHPLAFALTNFLALKGDRAHALVERVDKYERHCQREHGCGRGDAGKQRRNGLHVERVDQEFEHRTLFACLEIEIDHLLHHDHARNHPDRGSRQHDVTDRIGKKQRDIVRARQIHQRHHRDRQRADNGS